MGLTTVTRRFSFDAGHRILGHESKCRFIHGHTYLAEVTVTAPHLDDKGRVIDFSVLKKEVGAWIETNWDHNFLCHVKDLLNPSVLTARGQRNLIQEIVGREPFVMPADMQPTAENMSQVLMNTADRLLAKYLLTVVLVRIWETPNCHAEFHRTVPEEYYDEMDTEAL